MQVPGRRQEGKSRLFVQQQRCVGLVGSREHLAQQGRQRNMLRRQRIEPCSSLRITQRERLIEETTDDRQLRGGQGHFSPSCCAVPFTALASSLAPRSPGSDD